MPAALGHLCCGTQTDAWTLLVIYAFIDADRPHPAHNLLMLSSCTCGSVFIVINALRHLCSVCLVSLKLLSDSYTSAPSHFCVVMWLFLASASHFFTHPDQVKDVASASVKHIVLNVDFPILNTTLFIAPIE